MKQILVFGDSNTYGLDAATGGRFPWGVRWTSLLNEMLGTDGYNVIEEGLCGRTTVFDDLTRDLRNGAKVLPGVLEANKDLDYVIIMLGTNDCKTAYKADAKTIANGVTKLVKQVKSHNDKAKILLISPIHFGENVWKENYDPEFSPESIVVNEALAEEYKRVAKNESIYFMDASRYAEPSKVDEQHLDAEGHRALGQAIYNKLNDIIQETYS